MDTHPAAEFFPALADAEFETFKADIAAHGLREPIWLCEGKILDGRNRYRACCELGITPAFRTYQGDTPVAFAWSLNGTRRHLTNVQRVSIGLQMLPALETEARERRRATLWRGTQRPVTVISPDGKRGAAVAAAAALVGVSGTTLQRAKFVKEQAPKDFERIMLGELTIHSAYASARSQAAPRNHHPRADRIEEIRALARDGHRTTQIAEKLGITDKRVARIARDENITLPDHAMGHSHKIDARRVIEQSVSTLEGLALGLRTVDGARFNASPHELQEWLKSMDDSLRVISRVRTYIRKQST